MYIHTWPMEFDVRTLDWPVSSCQSAISLFILQVSLDYRLAVCLGSLSCWRTSATWWMSICLYFDACILKVIGDLVQMHDCTVCSFIEPLTCRDPPPQLVSNLTFTSLLRRLTYTVSNCFQTVQTFPHL